MAEHIRRIGNATIELEEGDITLLPCAAIVNAANQSLLGGGGVDGAIHQAGGPAILVECRKLGGCETGEAKATTAGSLPAQIVIHTVGPIWNGGDHGEAELLASCYRRSLEVATDANCLTVNFPAISAGVYRYPMDQAARVAIDTVTTELEKKENTITRVRFILFNKSAMANFCRVLAEPTNS